MLKLDYTQMKLQLIPIISRERSCFYCITVPWFKTT